MFAIIAFLLGTKWKLQPDEAELAGETFANLLEPYPVVGDVIARFGSPILFGGVMSDILGRRITRRPLRLVPPAATGGPGANGGGAPDAGSGPPPSRPVAPPPPPPAGFVGERTISRDDVTGQVFGV